MFKLIRELTIIGYYLLIILLTAPFVITIVVFEFIWGLLNARQA